MICLDYYIYIYIYKVRELTLLYYTINILNLKKITISKSLSSLIVVELVYISHTKKPNIRKKKIDYSIVI